jgi:hypothetical protein
MHVFVSLKGSSRAIRRLQEMVSITFSIAILLSTVGFAQGVRGTITGQVKDPNGSVVPGATVKLVNVATKQVARTAHTNNEGVYELVEVEPATYNVDITAQGFSEVILENAVVEPNRHLTLDATMAAAGATEQVTVSAGQELLDHDSATLGTTVDNQRVEGLPLNGRNILDLALLQPGVEGVSGSNGFGNGNGFRVNGARGSENNFTLNGANNNEMAATADFGNEPLPDAVQEFRLLTANFDPEFGRNTGSVINVIIKGGTGQYHGDARIFYRPTFLEAANFFDNLNDLPKQTFERKQYGGNFGGPVPIPFLDKGQKKTFFFVDYEGLHQVLGNVEELSLLPTAAEKNGNWSALLQPNNEYSKTPIQLMNPVTGQPFLGNIIPPGMISPIARYYLNFLPAPNATGQAGVQANEVTNTTHVTGRLDHTISDKQQVSFIANYFGSNDLTPFAFGGATAPGFGAANLQNTYNFIFQHTYAVSPTVVNSFLASYTRNNAPGVSPVNTTTPQQIGFTANFVANPTFAGPPFINLADSGLTIGNSIQGPQARISQNYQIQDSVSWVKGNHRFKFGTDGTKYFQPETFLFVNQGILSYSAQVGSPISTGLDIGDFQIGEGPIAQQYGANGQRSYRQLSYSFFAQDSWKVRENLTISYGLRWDYVGAITDKLDQVAYYRPGETSQLIASGQLKTPGGQLITSNFPVDGLVYPGDPDNILGGTVPRAGYHTPIDNFAPRLAIAYSPRADEGTFLRRLIGDNATVIRAGWGLYYDGAGTADTSLQQLSAPGFNGTNSFFFPAGGTLANPFAPSPYPAAAGVIPQIKNPFLASSFDVSAPLSSFAQPIDPHLKLPYTYQYNFTVERSFSKNYVVSFSYVGTRGIDLYAQEQINPALGTFFPFSDAITSPAPFGGFPVPNQNNANNRRTNPDIQLGLNELVSAGNSYYNAFQAQIQKRFHNGLLFQVAYTYSKSIDDSDNSRGGLDLLDRNAGKGLSSDDFPNRLVASWIYDLPFFKGSEGLKGRLFGGFSFGGIYTYASGNPFTVANPFDTVGTGGGIISNADLGSAYTQMNPQANGERAFNANAFQAFGNPLTGFNLATDFRRGTEGVNQVFANNVTNNWNLIVSKTNRLWSESTSLELRLEMFNAFNHTQFLLNGPNGQTGLDLNLNDPNFGKYESAAQSRVLQLGARFRF